MQSIARYQDKTSMNISLALGGGGAKGNSHIGVLRVLEQENYRIKAVAGTSFGGLVAVLYALGHSADALEDLLSKVDQKTLYGRDSNEEPALLGLSGVRKWLSTILGDATFKDLTMPCAVTAVEIHTGNEVIISQGRLMDAVLSTIALPGIFPPHRFNGWELMDGGVLNPVPVSVARMLNPADPVVAVVLNDPLNKPVRGYTLPVPAAIPKPIAERITRMSFAQAFDIFMRAVDLNSRAVAHYRLLADNPEVIVRPDVHHIDLLGHVNVHDVVKMGEDAMLAALPQLKRKASWLGRARRRVFGN